jgi:hypothetical protein
VCPDGTDIVAEDSISNSYPGEEPTVTTCPTAGRAGSELVSGDRAACRGRLRARLSPGRPVPGPWKTRQIVPPVRGVYSGSSLFGPSVRAACFRTPVPEACSGRFGAFLTFFVYRSSKTPDAGVGEEIPRR